MKKLLKRDGIVIDNVDGALKKLADDGFKKVYIQPTHMIEGEEFDLIANTADKFKDHFDCIKLGHALLDTEKDLNDVIDILGMITENGSDENTAKVFMGHGSKHAANSVYTKLQNTAEQKGFKNMFIGTVESNPDIHDIVGMLENKGFKKVILSPLMIVAGDHAANDMAGDEEDSWKSILTECGYEVICRAVGLGSEYEIQKLIVRHCGELLEDN